MACSRPTARCSTPPRTISTMPPAWSASMTRGRNSTASANSRPMAWARTSFCCWATAGRSPIANGGIETHPDFGRAELNIATMKPSYVLVDRLTGDLIEKHELPAGTAPVVDPPHGRRSIRHGLVRLPVPGGRAPIVRCWSAARRVARNCNCSTCRRTCCPASATISARSPPIRVAGTVAVSSPEGNSLAVIDAASGQIVSASALVEVCGLAPDRPASWPRPAPARSSRPAARHAPNRTMSGTTTCCASNRLHRCFSQPGRSEAA